MKANLESTCPFRLILGDQVFDRVEHDRELLAVFLFHCLDLAGEISIRIHQAACQTFQGGMASVPSHFSLWSSLFGARQLLVGRHGGHPSRENRVPVRRVLKRANRGRFAYLALKSTLVVEAPQVEQVCAAAGTKIETLTAIRLAIRPHSNDGKTGINTGEEKSGSGVATCGYFSAASHASARPQ
jgi:hypothetical protein